MKALAFALALSSVAGCTHSFGTPAVTTIHEAGGMETDVAWMIEDEHHVVRCQRDPDGHARCERASFR